MKRYGSIAVLLLHMTLPVVKFGPFVPPGGRKPVETLISTAPRDSSDAESIVAPTAGVSIEGRVLSVGITRLSISTMNSNEPISFSVAKDADVILNGHTASLLDLTMGDVAIVTVQRMGRTLIATGIQAHSPM